MAKTLFDKVWDAHIVKKVEGDQDMIYIDKHFIHEVTSPQAFAELKKRDLPIYRKENMVATPDHNVPTLNQHLPITEDLSRNQVDTLLKNCAEHNIDIYELGHENHGIVHVIGPELGITKPGMTIVCGDSHTSTHGAFGAIAFGIGTSQVAMVMASQCLLQSKPKVMRITVDGDLNPGVGAKDVILYIISKLGTGGGTGYFVEFAGSTIRQLSMEGRMTICNMSIEMGARGGMIAPDEITLEYMKGRDFAPKQEVWSDFEAYCTSLKTDEDAQFDMEYNFDAKDIAPMITYGTNPGMGIGIDEQIPSLAEVEQVDSFKKSLNYMGFEAGEKLIGKPINWVFIGSCTNSRIEDLREVAAYIKGKKKADNVNAIIVPGSRRVEQQAKEEDLHKVFEEAGFLLREPGCSACLAMNEDKIPEGEYCVSTSNRNFEGRQGKGSRTLLSSPLMAAAVAIAGEIVDYRSHLN